MTKNEERERNKGTHKIAITEPSGMQCPCNNLDRVVFASLTIYHNWAGNPSSRKTKRETLKQNLRKYGRLLHPTSNYYNQQQSLRGGGRQQEPTRDLI